MIGKVHSAHAYVRDAPEGHPDLPVYWAKRRIELRPAYESAGAMADVFRTALLNAMAEWEMSGGRGCTDIVLEEGPAPTSLTTNLGAGTKGKPGTENRIVWHQDHWPGEKADSLAVTTKAVDPNTGEIVSADIDINGKHPWWLGGAPNKFDIESALAHELGHLLGLDHSPESEATMYFEMETNETKKRDLHSDDIEGVCTIYPKGGPTLKGTGSISSGLTSTSGCSVSTRKVDFKGAWPHVAICALLFFRRRRRFSTAPPRR